jgi:hypothetical protein
MPTLSMRVTVRRSTRMAAGPSTKNVVDGVADLVCVVDVDLALRDDLHDIVDGWADGDHGPPGHRPCSCRSARRLLGRLVDAVMPWVRTVPAKRLDGVHHPLDRRDDQVHVRYRDALGLCVDGVAVGWPVSSFSHGDLPWPFSGSIA